jgi:hypothetical protein
MYRHNACAGGRAGAYRPGTFAATSDHTEAARKEITMAHQRRTTPRRPWVAVTAARRNVSLSVGGTQQRLTLSRRGLSLSIRLPGTGWTWTWRWTWRRRHREPRRAR